MPRRTLENPLGLDPVEGEAITEIAVKILGQNVAFNKPLSVDVVLLEQMKGQTHGDVVYAVVELTRGGFDLKRATAHDGWKRVDSYTLSGMALASDEVAIGLVHEQRQRVELAIEAANSMGLQTEKLPLDGDGKVVGSIGEAQAE